ncbi:major capsid protein [Aneurinibacillus migulanus]|uniref:Coat protein n=1 Tax=Aneurinibacillus migulanus TaxID=47500 RepID=A0A0D1XPB6_ANEMI|nr:major capsid protein [Aneurinibacillus migulanus]KIV56211.1 hypothetical protein TS65_13410 [Aneurinibacillus migulanus]KON84276.1 hypothetical protein AF333_30555 [Aneurinibacillus migulanus]MED0893825.1 major capsid protein [Aneurinibacillus migulanus]MED1614504.1 major capsid protein [Aneurinibacillus migulanus]SDI83928.1 hypothetical protein SAMN04487909_108125 [Aneurinibacillus migulanus]
MGAKTKISDVIVPELFNPYVIDRTTEKSALFSSGIIATNPELDKLASAGGKILHMPQWNDLTGESQILSDTVPLETKKITTSQDMARLHMRGDAWSTNDLAGALAGSDPMKAIGDLVANYWARDMQRILIATLNGVFAAASMGGNLHDISKETGDAAKFTAKSFIDAQFKLGDAYESLTAIAVHSRVYAEMNKQDLIQFIQDSSGRLIATYRGFHIIVDDGIPFDNTNGIFTTYLFGAGAIGYAEGTPDVPTETDRDSLQGDNYLINRKHFVLHPRGVKWEEGSIAGESPTNAELADGTHWTRVWDNKKIRVVKFVHKI